MKTALAAILLAALLVAGCGQSTAWMYGDSELAGVRAGTMVTENNEVFILSEWQHEDDSGQVFGVGVAHHVPGEYPIPNPFGGEALVAVCTYFGVQTTLDDDYDSRIALFTGFEFFDILFTELQFAARDNGDSDEVRGVLGARMEF